MTEQDTMVNLHNDLFFTVQKMKEFIQVFETSNRRDYLTHEDICIMRQALDSIVVEYDNTMQALARADENI